MALANIDPLEAIIADGRIHTRPTQHYGIPDVLTIDLELLHTTLLTRIETVFQNSHQIRLRYVGTSANVTNAITQDTTAMCDYLIGQTYNRLRNILERKAPHVRVTRMNTRCPVPANMEFPTWISSTLSSIGPCRIVDGPSDRLVVYATTSATMQNYGRFAPTVFNEGHYFRLLSILKELNFSLSPFDFTGNTGSYYSFIEPVLGEHTWSLYGLVHSSHFENEDVARIALCTSNVGATPFENIGVTIGYVNDATTIEALAAVAAPEGIPAGQTAGSGGRPVGVQFNVNYYGIQPAVAAQAATPAQPRGIYILGRGVDRYYQCVLANQVASTEVLEILRFRIMRKA